MIRTTALASLAVVLLGTSSGCGGGGDAPPSAPIQYGLTVNRGGTGQGTVSGPGIACGPAASTCSNTYAAGTVVALTASASAGSSFAGWSGPCSGTGNCVLTMNSISSVTATFTLGGRMLTVTAAGGGTGTITSSPAGITCPGTCSAGFADGAVVTLTALAGGASTFAGWSGACTGTGLCDVTLAADSAVTATFLPGPGSLNVVMAGTGSGTVTSSPAGVSCPSTCSPTFAAGTVVTLTAMATVGSTFTGWSGLCSGSGSCVVTMSGTATVTATFATSPGGHTLTVTTAGNGTGTITSSPAGISCPGTCSASFASVGGVILTAAPATGSVLVGWSGACTGTGPTCNTDATMDRSTTVTFTRPVLTVTTSGDGAGRITSTPAGIDCSSGSSAGCSASFDSGSSVTLTAAPGATASFPGWFFDPCFGVQGPCTFSMSADRTLYIVFSGWTAVRPFPTSLHGAVEFGSTRIAVGGGGAVVTSTDSVSWAGHPTGFAQTLRGVATNATAIAVAVGDLGTILTSADGVTWSSRTSGTTVALQGVARGAGLFVAVGATGVILTSADGIGWTPRTSTTTENLLAVTFGAGQFVATGYAGTILTSADGLAWTSRISNTTQYLAAVTWDPKGFVAVGSAGVVLTSTNAVAWTSRGPLGAAPSPVLVGVTALAGTYAAADAVNKVYTSTDGISWTAHLLDPTGLIYPWSATNAGIVTVGGEFVALGLRGSLLRSSDGAAWSLALVDSGAGPFSCGLSDAAFGNSIYVVVGCYGSVFTSPDGVAWTARRADLRATNGRMEIAFGADAVNAFVAVSDSGIIRSTDGITWTSVAPAPGLYGGYVAYQPGLGFVVVGLPSGASPILTSLDGTTWTTQATGITSSLEAISCGASRCVALGGSGVIYTNPSPGTVAAWTPRSFPVPNSGWQSGIEFGNSTFVVPVGAGTYTSADGTSWAGPHPVSPAPGKMLTFGNGVFMATNLMTSADGVTWVSMTGPTVAGGPGGTQQVSSIEGAAYGPAGWIGIASLWNGITVDGFFVFLKHP